MPKTTLKTVPKSDAWQRLGPAEESRSIADAWNANRHGRDFLRHFSGWRLGRRGADGGFRTVYQVTECLHGGRTVHVPADAIAATVSAWLAEKGACSPLADDLAGAVRGGDWAAAHRIADYLSMEIGVAA
jgi:hypothetical protein